MKQLRNIDIGNNINIDYNYNSNLEKSKQNYYNIRNNNNNYFISDLERSKQNYYNLKNNNDYNIKNNNSDYISDLERSKQKYYDIKNNKNNDYYIYIPNQNELFTLGNNDNDNENKNLNNNKINSNNKNKYNNPLVTKLSNIANSISLLDYLIKKNIYDNFIPQLKFNLLFSKISRFIIRLYRFYINTSKKNFINKLREMKQINYGFYKIRKKYAKIQFMKALKQNYLMCKYEQNLYLRKLKVKSFYGLFNNKLRRKHKKNKDNNALAFYYQTIIKKLFLMLKFNYHNSEKFQKKQLLEYQNKKRTLSNDDYNNNNNILNNEDDITNYNYKIFNFFHSNENEDEDEKNSEENFQKYNKMFDKENIKEIKNRLNEENTFNKMQDDLKENSENDVDNLLLKLENKYSNIIKKSKSKLNTSNLTKYSEYSKYNSNKYNQYNKDNNEFKRGKSDIMKEYGNHIKFGKKKSNICTVTCPYCSAGIPHDVCIGNSNGPIDDILGAPKFMQRTRNFAHKKL